MNSIGLQTFVSREVGRFIRVSIQTLVSPWINAVLYIFIFGFVVGSRIDLISGVTYIDFVLPGILMLNIISAAFSQSSSSLYFQRFAKHIEEILVAPLSHLEMIIGYIVGAVARAVVVGLGIYILAIIFGAASVAHFFLLLFYVVSVSVIFAFLGLLVGLWSNNFEQLSILNTFIIMPLTFLGGVFNSIFMLPERVQVILRFNPFFYFVDGLRFSMVGVQEANPWIGLAIIFVLIFGLGSLVWYLFKIGWRIRN